MATRDTSPTSIASALSNIDMHRDNEAATRSSVTASPPTSTPPTSLGDEASILSGEVKMEHTAEAHEELLATPQAPVATPTAPQSTPAPTSSEGRRPTRSSRKSVVTYNVQILAGTAIHTPTKYLEKHHSSVLHGDIEEVIQKNPAPSPKRRSSRRQSQPEPIDLDDPAEQQLAAEAAQAAQRRTSSRVTDLRREALRNLSGVGDASTNTLSSGKDRVQSTLKRSASDSRLSSSMQSAPSVPAKRSRNARGNTSDEGHEEEEEEEKEYVKPKTKQWLKQGLYVGQDRLFDPRLSESRNRARRKSRAEKESTALPLPIFAGEKMLEGDPCRNYRDFKLPFDVYNPLPRKVKVDGWVKLNKSELPANGEKLF